MKMEECCFYQDLWADHHRKKRVDNDDIDADNDDDVSDIFFQLANAPLVGYRLPDSTGNSRNEEKNEKTQDSHSIGKEGDANRPEHDHTKMIIIEQDVESAAQKHTGGIVWETAYLLLEYLLAQLQPTNENVVESDSSGRTNLFSFLEGKSGGRTKTVVELGAGCGMLGLTIHKALEMKMDKHQAGGLQWRVILTETDEVMDNLRRNFQRNSKIVKAQPPASSSSCPPTASVCELDWTKYREHCQAAGIDAHSVDLILGTDVVFSTRFVEPLLQTMEYLCHDKGTAILCLQERCPDSHALLLDKANQYGFIIDDVSECVFDDYRPCRFGRDLDCKILQFTRDSSGGFKKKRKESKKSKKPKRSKSKDKKKLRTQAG
jgi:predicted nicotinamide N-methyase